MSRCPTGGGKCGQLTERKEDCPVLFMSDLTPIDRAENLISCLHFIIFLWLSVICSLRLRVFFFFVCPCVCFNMSSLFYWMKTRGKRIFKIFMSPVFRCKNACFTTQSFSNVNIVFWGLISSSLVLGCLLLHYFRKYFSLQHYFLGPVSAFGVFFSFQSLDLVRSIFEIKNVR